MAKNKTYTCTLQLIDINHLFQKPDLSPFSKNYQVYSYIAGIEYLSNELYADPSYEAVKLNILLPPEQITSGLEAQTTAAVNLYCQGRLQDVAHDIHATLWRGKRALGLALIALFVLIGAARIVFAEDSLFRQIISEGLSIAAWVGLWAPLDMLVFKIWEHRLDKKIYTLLSTMKISIVPIGQPEVNHDC